MFFLVNIVLLPFITMRAEPDAEAEVVSQAIFSEVVTVLNTQDHWHFIQTPDGYRGWVDQIQKVDCYRPTHQVIRQQAHLYRDCTIKKGPLMTLPYGAKLEVLQANDRWAETSVGWILCGDIKPIDILSMDQMVSLSLEFLNIPYTWGGRSSLGFDCSGFSEFLYQQMGIKIQRDACQQVLDPKFITVDVAKPGDLVFFGNPIDHVGISLDKDLFIHATGQENKPWIRISSLKEAYWIERLQVIRRLKNPPTCVF